MLLHGLLGYPGDQAAELLNSRVKNPFYRISKQALLRRYRDALAEITYLMNGGE